MNLENCMKTEEAFRVASETQHTLLNIVQAEGDSQAKELQAYVHTLFAESRLVFLSLFGDLPSLAFHVRTHIPSQSYVYLFAVIYVFFRQFSQINL